MYVCVCVCVLGWRVGQIGLKGILKPLTRLLVPINASKALFPYPRPTPPSSATRHSHGKGRPRACVSRSDAAPCKISVREARIHRVCPAHRNALQRIGAGAILEVNAVLLAPLGMSSLIRALPLNVQPQVQ